MPEDRERCRVVLLDDGGGHLLALAGLLSEGGYDVQTADLSVEGVEAVRGLDHPVVVAGGSGPLERLQEQLASISGANASACVIVATGHAAGPATVRAAGVFGHLPVPVQAEVMAELLERARERQALAAGNARLREGAEAQSRRIGALLRAVDQVNSHLELPAVTRSIVESAVAITGAQSGYAALIADGRLRVSEFWDGVQWMPDQLDWVRGSGIPGTVWDSGASLRGNAADPGSPALGEPSQRFQRRSFLCAPILDRRGEVAGVIEVMNRHSDASFSDEDLEMLEGLGVHVSIAIHNARYVGELQEAHRRLLEVEAQKRQFHRDVMLAATGGKLILCDPTEMDAAAWSKAPLLARVNALGDIPRARRQLLELMGSLEMEPERLDNFLVACGEATTNALIHGGGGFLRAQTRADRVLVRVEDGGQGIDSLRLPQATLQPGVSLSGSLGMGFSLILSFVDKLMLSTGSEGTILVMECFLQSQDAGLPFFNLDAFSELDAGPEPEPGSAHRPDEPTRGALPGSRPLPQALDLSPAGRNLLASAGRFSRS